MFRILWMTFWGEHRGVPAGHGDHDDDGHHGFMVTLGPGATASVTVTIPDDAVGDWEIGCFRDKGSHWSSGMHATLRIRA
jgi:hypothetical protein